MQLCTPTSSNASIDDAEHVNVSSRPPTSIRLRPIIQSDSYVAHTYGKLTSLKPALLNLILEMLDLLGPQDKFVLTSRQGSQNCIERRLQAHSASCWTNEQPGCFACRTCFNRRQPCMRAVGMHEFVLLPLPVEVRETDTTWQDGAYYIYQ